MNSVNNVPGRLIMKWGPDDLSELVPRVFELKKDPSAVSFENPDGYVKTEYRGTLDVAMLEELKKEASQGGLRIAAKGATTLLMATGALVLALAGAGAFASPTTWGFMGAMAIGGALPGLIDSASTYMADIKPYFSNVYK